MGLRLNALRPYVWGRTVRAGNSREPSFFSPKPKPIDPFK